MIEDPVDFFNDIKARKPSQGLAKELAKDYDKALELESKSISSSSPKMIEIDEIVGREIYATAYYDKEDNVVKPAAYAHIFGIGMSVNRILDGNEQDIHTRGKEKATENKCLGKQNSEYIGFAALRVKDIREITINELSDVPDDNRRLMAIYDSATRSNRYHADVCLILHKSGNISYNQIKLYCNAIMSELFATIVHCK